MSGNIFVTAEHLDGQITDATFELLALGRELGAQTGGSVDAGLVGAGVSSLAGELGGADTVVVVDDAALEAFNPDSHARVFSHLVTERDPQIVLVPYTSIGMDVASHIAVAADLPLVSYCKSVSASGVLGATCSLYAGKLDARVEVDGERAVFAVLSGATSGESGRSGGAGNVEAVAVPEEVAGSPITFVGLAHPEGGDVDITAQDVLVVVGRGIGDEDSIEEAQELADALDGAVAASRPIVDQGWLPKTRQVGKSGLTVKPKVYLALGVSGAPEHIEGMRDAATIIAVNTDPAAPIFGVAHYGWVGDLFDLLPELTDRLEG
jgi:electron transfer flavoprotein alpha subunit